MAGGSQNRTIGKLDFPEPNQRTPLLHENHNDGSSTSRQPSPASTRTGRFFQDVAEGIQAKDREALKRETLRYVSFFWAVVCCLCAGSITAFSLYAPLFQSRLHYSQARINTVSIVAELAMYLPVPIFGFFADRYGPPSVVLFASVVFGLGYFLAAFTYRSQSSPEVGGHSWPFGVMVLAFVGVGLGTSSMYLAAVTTCAKNFGRGKHKGLALAVPIASFGLSGMWQSQLGSRLLFVRTPEGGRGDVDVFRYFLFLGGLLLGVGVVGFLLLRVVDETDLIDDAVEQLEQSGLLEDDDFYVPQASSNGYGAVDNVEERRPSTAERLQRRAKTLEKQEQRRKKSWLLNEETRRFLSDPTMWWLAAGFFLVSGPGEAFINNLGTIIGTLSPPDDSSGPGTSPATHVSIVAVASTVARILSGTLSDLLGPKWEPHQHRRGPNSLNSSLSSLDPLPVSSSNPNSRRPTISRLTLLLTATILLCLGQILLASGMNQNHAHDRLWIVSTLIGIGYGAVFSLVPIIISCIWGIENFGTNWGIVATAPAFGALVWGAVYAAVYEWAAHGRSGDGRCFGVQCYSITFWGMAGGSLVACGMWVWAWRGPGGWRRRGVAV